MKEIRWTIFHKIVLFIIVLLIPVVGLYSYTGYVSESVVRGEIRASLTGRLSFLENRLNTQVNHMARSAFQLSEDPSLDSVDTLDSFKNYFDVIQFKDQLQKKVAVLSVTLEWPAAVTVYFPNSEQVISTESAASFDGAYLSSRVNRTWQAWPSSGDSGSGYDFYFYAVTPFADYRNPLHADNIVEMKFSGGSLTSILDDYKQSGQGDPFLYREGFDPILNGTADPSLVRQVIDRIRERPAGGGESFLADLNGESYWVNVAEPPALGWKLVDFVPVQQVMTPIEKSKTLFYVSTSLLLVAGIAASFLLYRQVQIPIRTLVRNLGRIKRGDFSARIGVPSSGEFSYVFQRFNEMTEQIGVLIDQVYREELSRRDAQLKQLQSQINPHFLYNCLYFIVNMIRLRQDEAAEKMAYNLGDYYKYTTRLEKPDATVAEELRLVEHYLDIQKLRMPRISFSIGMPESMLELEIPRLLLQPIVENAVVHGLEPKPGGGAIRVTGQRSGGQAEIIVEDDGVGMSKLRMAETARRLDSSMAADTGYGVWNVNQRLRLRFGAGSGVRLETSPGGGLRVVLNWRILEEGGFRP